MGALGASGVFLRVRRDVRSFTALFGLLSDVCQTPLHITRLQLQRGRFPSFEQQGTQKKLGVKGGGQTDWELEVSRMRVCNE